MTLDLGIAPLKPEELKKEEVRSLAERKAHRSKRCWLIFGCAKVNSCFCCALLPFLFFGEGTKTDYREKGILILTSLLEGLEQLEQTTGFSLCFHLPRCHFGTGF